MQCRSILIRTANRSVFLLVCLIILFTPNRLPAFLPTDDNLRTTESAHFTYIYQAALEDHIPKLIKDCEDAYALLTPIFRWKPRSKVFVLFSDSRDIHNGWATIFPRPTMMIFASDNLPGSTAYEPGDSIRRTVFHEFTHILSMDPQTGLDGALAGIFGRVLPSPADPLSMLITFFAIPPGAVAPPWFIEGLALWVETEMVGSGRGRNTLVDMIFRVATEKKCLLPPTHWDLNTPDWPFGNTAYIYGMKMIQHTQETYGFGEEEKNIVGELSLSAAHSFPFFFSSGAYSITGHSFSELAWQSLEHERSRQKKRIGHLSSQPFTAIKRLTPADLQVYHPRFDRSGEKIFFSGALPDRRDSIYQYNTDNTGKSDKPLSRLHRMRADGPFSKLAPSPDRSVYYYTRLDSPRREKLVSQLYRYDPEQRQSRKITGEGRYRFPAVDTDHAKLAAVRDEAGRQTLLEVPLAHVGDRNHERLLVAAPPGTSLIDPVYAPGDPTLVYIRADETSSQLRRLHLESGEDTILVEWPAIITSPAFHPAGQELVFVSDKNGVYNLYRMPYQPGAKPVAITHAFGGVFQPDFSPDGQKLAVSAYDESGYYLSVLDYTVLKDRGDNLPQLEPTWTPLAVNENNHPTIKTKFPDIPDTQKYRPYRAIWPYHWSPWLEASTDGIQGGVFLKMSDPVFRHQLSIKGGYESEHKTPLASVIYNYSGFEPILSLYGYNDQIRYKNLLKEANGTFYDYDEETGGAGAALTFPFERVDRRVYLSLGYQWHRSRTMRKTAEKYPLFTGDEAAVWIHLESLCGTAFRRSHSLEDGRLLSLFLERTDEMLGGDLDRTRILGAWNEYVTLPWSNNHVLKLEGHYGVSRGDKTAQSAFGLGGFDTITASTPGMPRSLTLRGYNENTQVGTGIIKAGAAYRFPIIRFYQGVNATAPYYLRQLSGEVFYEGGSVTGSPMSRSGSTSWINAYGAEINIGLTLRRWIDIAPGIGAVYAVDRELNDNTDSNKTKKWQVYFTLKSIIHF